MLEVLIKADIERRPFEDVMYSLWRDVVCASEEHRARAEMYFSSGLHAGARRSKAPRRSPRPRPEETRIHLEGPWEVPPRPTSRARLE